MDNFVSYLVGNWNVNGSVSIEKRYVHVRKTIFDRILKMEREVHVVSVGLKYYDKDNICLGTYGVKFVDNYLNAGSKKKLVNISPDELENRFGVARDAILDVIEADYKERIRELNGKVSDIGSYRERDRIGISKEFSPLRMRILDAHKKKEEERNKKSKDIIVEQVGNVIENESNKKKFDM